MKTEQALLIAGILLLGAFFPVRGLLIPLDHPAYPSIDALVLKGFLPGLNGSPRPWEAAQVLKGLEALDTAGLSPTDRHYYRDIGFYLKEYRKKDPAKSSTLLLSAQEDAAGTWQDTLSYHTRHSGGAGFEYGRFSLACRAAADLTSENSRFDHLEKRFKGEIYADMPQSCLSWTGEKAGFLLGRNRVKWGPGRFGNLLLGDDQPPLNLLSAWTRLGFLEGHALSTRLTPLNEVGPRYFSASRLVIHVKKNLSLGLSQSVVYAARGRDFELHYVLPSFVYYFGQFGFSENNETDNIFLGADADWRFLRRYRLYGEFLADDFQVDRDERSRGTQNAIAVLLGLESGRILCDALSGGIEFAHVNSYVYKHMGQWPTSYAANTHGGTLGHRIGPDSEELDAWLALRISRFWQAGARYTLTRHGDLSNPLLLWDAYDKAGEAVPHGRVEDTHLLLLNGGLIHWKGLSVTGEAGYVYIRDKGNLPPDDSGVRAGARLLYHWDRLIQWNDRETLFQPSPTP